MCVFGCDFLYENDHVFVRDGVIRTNISSKLAGAAGEALRLLEGCPLAERWQRGDPGYFRRPPGKVVLPG